MLIYIGLILAILTLNSCIRLLEPLPGKTDAPPTRQFFAVCGFLAVLFLSYNLYQSGIEATKQAEQARQSMELQERINSLLGR